jgi:DNA-binding NtrC family response regulator
MNSKYKVLVVDDEEFLRDTLFEVLKNQYEVIQAASGFEALEKIKENLDTKVILLDMRMPEMDGIDTLKKIQELKKEVALECEAVILTAVLEIQAAIQAVKLGAYDYLTKPFQNADLLAVVKKALNRILKKNEIVQMKTSLEESKKKHRDYKIKINDILHAAKIEGVFPEREILAETTHLLEEENKKISELTERLKEFK